MTDDDKTYLSNFIAKRVEDDCGCQVWKGSVDTWGVPTIRRARDKKLLSTRRVVMELAGRDIAGKVVISNCPTELCVKVDHLKAITRAKLQEISSKGKKHSFATRARMAEASRKNSKLTMEKVREMRASGLSTVEAARAYGIAQTNASQILNHKMWVDYSNPFAGLMT